MPNAVGSLHGLCGKAGAPPLRYSFEDLEEERQTVDGLDCRG
jgi:hypothetical protein